MVVLPRLWGRRILLEPLGHIAVEVAVNKYKNQFPPVLWPRMNWPAPIGKPTKFNPQFIWERLFPGAHFFSQEKLEFSLQGIQRTLVLIARHLINCGLDPSLCKG